jgi:cyclopropane fatty-acyl-phospholipid synthase-like methyltransferase
MDNKVFKNHTQYLERLKTYQKYGYDTLKERRFILETAQPLSGSILEIGTGKGHMAIVMAQAGLRFTSVDSSAEEQEFARMNIEYLGLLEQVTFEIEDAAALTFTAGSYDKIISVNTIHHLEAPFVVMDEMVRVLATRGRIILSDFTEAGLEVINAVHESEGHTHSVSAVGLPQVSEYLVSKNFAIKKVSSQFQDVVIAYNLK